MTLGEIRDRLISELKPATLTTVGTAAEFAALQDNLPQPHELPAAYVVPTSDVGGKREDVTTFTQLIDVTVGVILIVPAQGDRRGAAALEDIETVKNAVRDALVGWRPATAFTDVVFVRGALGGFPKRVIIWISEFRAQVHVRKS